jgi:hypothetical protein
MAKRPQPDLTSVRIVIDNATEPPTTGREDASGERPPPRQPPALPPGCPVIPLGMMGDIRYYFDAAGQLVALRVTEHTRLNILGLFGSKNHLVFEYWPKTDEKGKIKGWRTEDAESQLMALAAARGLWSPMNKARGRGCWSDETARLIVHFGDRILIDGQTRRPGLFGELAFVAREKLMDTAPKTEPAGPRGVGEEALSLLRCWKWRRDIAPRLLLGWIGVAFLGASLRVRPVAWIIGRRGTGKSILQEVLAAVLGEWPLSVSDSTEAGIRQTLEHDCLPIAIDEAEGDGGNSKDGARLRSLVKLVRRCYSGSQSLRGGTDHEASGFTLRSTMLFSSIRTPALTPQDGSRMAVLKLEDQPPGAALPDLNPVRLCAIGARILRRLIDQWPRLSATLDQYRSARNYRAPAELRGLCSPDPDPNIGQNEMLAAG